MFITYTRTPHSLSRFLSALLRQLHLADLSCGSKYSDLALASRGFSGISSCTALILANISCPQRDRRNCANALEASKEPAGKRGRCRERRADRRRRRASVTLRLPKLLQIVETLLLSLLYIHLYPICMLPYVSVCNSSSTSVYVNQPGSN